MCVGEKHGTLEDSVMKGRHMRRDVLMISGVLTIDANIRVKRSLFELTNLPLDLGVLLTSEISVGVWLSALNPPI